MLPRLLVSNAERRYQLHLMHLLYHWNQSHHWHSHTTGTWNASVTCTSSCCSTITSGDSLNVTVGLDTVNFTVNPNSSFTLRAMDDPNLATTSELFSSAFSAFTNTSRGPTTANLTTISGCSVIVVY